MSVVEPNDLLLGGIVLVKLLFSKLKKTQVPNGEGDRLPTSWLVCRSSSMTLSSCPPHYSWLLLGGYDSWTLAKSDESLC